MSKKSWLRPTPYQRLSFVSIEESFDQLCIDIEPRCELTPDSRVVTFGSCFAKNMAQTLRSQGVSATSIEIVEWINTPLANRFYLQAALGEVSFKDRNDHPAGVDLDIAVRQIIPWISSANIVIFTVGVGYVWMRKSDDQFVIIPDVKRVSNYRTRYLPLSEQVTILQDIVTLVHKINPVSKIWITLSPVPLEFSLNYASSVVSDCVSKSILRSAIHETLVRGARFEYFPSFEFFRWLSGHFDRKFYGADGKVRHVDQDLVDIVVKKFIALNDGSLMNQETS